ncbi:MAG: ATP-dependent DNA ligase [Sulfuricaulis sp.]
MNIRESITLYFRESQSDKVYQAQINETPAGCTVTFAYGRRGSALKDGTKTTVPVPYENAKKIYDKLIGEKTAKGYTPGKDGTPFTGASMKERSGINCQLLNAIGESEAMRMCLDPTFVAQEKMNGERRLLERNKGATRGINRNGLYVAVTEPVQESALRFNDGKFVIDGELIGDVLHAFDVLDASGDVRHLTYRNRLGLLQDMFEAGSGENTMVLVPTAYTTAEKLALFKRVKAEGGEGVVFKRLDACYTAGRPESGGNAFKFKFYAACSAVVTGISDGKRSVGLVVYDNGNTVPVGNVTIPPNDAIPAVSDVVEIRYLYAHRGGSLFQPVYLGKRNDIDASECVIAQIKFKQDVAA